MNRYYMTAETRQHLIAESNRLIAARAAANSARRGTAGASAADPGESDWSPAQDDGEARASDVESAFARLVADLRETSVRSEPS